MNHKVKHNFTCKTSEKIRLVAIIGVGRKQEALAFPEF